MLILASQSAIRSAMLQQAGLAFTVKPSPFDEEGAKAALEGLPFAARALALARGKAQAVSAMQPEAYVIGADQLCADATQIYGKPHTIERAVQHLHALQGKPHWQHSAACLYHQGELLWEACEVVTLTMHPLSDAEIRAYIAEDMPLVACGAYAYEKQGHRLFARIEGSAEAIKGLPLQGLLTALQTHYMKEGA